MNNSKRFLLGSVATLSLFATATPVFATSMSDAQYATQANKASQVSHVDYTTNVSKSTSATQATQKATTSYTTQATKASLVEGWNVVSGDSGQICYVKNGVKQTGWVNYGGWRYFDPSTGYMKLNSWLQDGGSWYYLGCDGRMLSSTFVSGLGSFNASGAWLGYEQASGISASTGKITVDASRSSTASKIITVDEFNAKVASGSIKAYVVYGSTAGGAQVGTLHWYLA